MSDLIRIRKAIGALPTYKAGKKAQAVAGLEAFKLSSNENPLPPLSGIIEVINNAALDVNRYPDPLTTELTAALAKRFDVPAECIATGTGSVGVCQQIVQAVADAGDEVIFAWRSFEAYPIITTIAGAIPVRVGLNDKLGHDLDAMAAAITERTSLILVCTPNNPTGTTVTSQQFDDFMQKVPADVLVIVDEAYVEFNRDDAAVDGLAAFRKYSNVGVLRTFSKAYGLAALRIGFFIGPVVVADAVRKTAVPFGVSNIAQAAAVASLELEDELLKRVDQIALTRQWFEDQLKAIGFDLPASQANFVWLPLGDRTDEFNERCAAVAVAVRPFSGEGVRISIGEQAALERVLEVAKDFLP